MTKMISVRKSVLLVATAFAAVLLGGCPKAEAPETESEPEPPADITNETQRASWRRMHNKEYLAKLKKQEGRMKIVAQEIDNAAKALAEARSRGAEEAEITSLSNALTEAYFKLDATTRESQQIVREQIIKDHLKHGNLKKQKKGAN